MQRITEVPCYCPQCAWSGVTGEAEPDVDGDGSLGCPKCFPEPVVVVIVEDS